MPKLTAQHANVRYVSLNREFKVELNALRVLHRLSTKEFARELGFSPQYLCDLQLGRRMPSVAFIHAVTRLLKLQHRQASKRYWHTIAARTHGWDI